MSFLGKYNWIWIIFLLLITELLQSNKIQGSNASSSAQRLCINVHTDENYKAVHTTTYLSVCSDCYQVNERKCFQNYAKVLYCSNNDIVTEKSSAETTRMERIKTLPFDLTVTETVASVKNHTLNISKTTRAMNMV